MATIEKRLKCAAKDLEFVIEFPAALPALDRNALVLALVSVRAVYERFRKAREDVATDAPAR